MSDDRFCYRCGAKLPDFASFCPECGMQFQGSTDSTSYEEPRCENRHTRRESKLKGIPTFVSVYGILAIIGSILYISTGLSIETAVETLRRMAEQFAESNPELSQQLYDMMNQILAFGTDNVKFMMCSCGALMLASGILAMFAGNYASHRRKWQLSVTFCGIASALPLVGILISPNDAVIDCVLAAIGFIMTYLIYSDKDAFES